MYEADPFFGFAEREKAREVAAKAREKKQKQQEEAKKAHNLQPGAAMPSSRGPSPNRNLLKGWERVPKIELGKKTRKEAKEDYFDIYDYNQDNGLDYKEFRDSLLDTRVNSISA